MKKNEDAFPNITLSQTKRLKIKEICLASVFKPRNIELMEQRYELGELLHKHVHTPYELRVMEECPEPKRIFLYTNGYHYYVEGWNKTAVTRHQKYWCRDLSSSQRSFTKTHPVGIMTALVHDIEEGMKRDKEVFSRELTALLNSCKNTKELITKWPESTQYIGFLFEKKEAPVPVIYSGDHLNQLIAKLQENPQCRTESNQEVQEPSKCKNIQNGKP